MTIFEVQSGGTTYEVDAPDQDTAIRGIQEIVAGSTGKANQATKGDMQPMAAGAVPHAMPAETVQGGPTPEPTRSFLDLRKSEAQSTGADIGDSAASRLLAGILDIPGIPGDVVSLVDMGADAAARGIGHLTGMSQEEIDKMSADAAKRPSLPWLPRSQDVKDFVGFKPFEPQSEGGKTFDKWGGGAIELAPSVIGGEAGALGRLATTAGAKAVAKKAAGDAAKYAAAPAVAGEAVGEVTDNPLARALAMVAAGGIAGAGKAKVMGAKSIDEWRAAAKQSYRDASAAGVVVKPAIFDSVANGIAFDAKLKGFNPAIHSDASAALQEVLKAKGGPKTIEELDQLHQIAMEAAKSPKPADARMGSIIADKIDDFMMNLKPGDLQAGDPIKAAAELKNARESWRRMRTSETIQNIMEKARDRVGANYTSAGFQTALRQEFKNWKWKGRQESREYKRLAPEEKQLVDQIIRGVSVENALRMVGKLNIRNPFVWSLMTALGMTGNPIAAMGIPAVGEAARAASAKMTIGKANRLDEIIRGGKVAPRPRRGAPNPILYGSAAERESDRSK